jgi:hypothetical protein
MALRPDRLEPGGSSASLRSDKQSAAEIVGRLESGASPANLGVAPADLIAALAWSGLGGDDSLGPVLAQAQPARPKLAPALSETALAPLFPGSATEARLALAAGLLQIHDFWEGSHEAAQRADDLGEGDFSAYWHGIAHRREPDPGNAAYWFRRVGPHAVFSQLAAAARPLVQEHADNKLSGSLLAGPGWNPFAMIDLCTQARAGSASETLARRLQRLEMWLLLEATFAPLAASVRS